MWTVLTILYSLPLSLVTISHFLQYLPPTLILSVAPLLPSCLESIDLAEPNLICRHGFLCASLPIYIGFDQGARYWYLRLSSTAGFPISEVSSEGVASSVLRESRFSIRKASLRAALLDPGARQVSSAVGVFSFIKQHCLWIPGKLWKGREPCKLLFLTQSILIIIIVTTYVIALRDEEGRREYSAISQHTPVP